MKLKTETAKKTVGLYILCAFSMVCAMSGSALGDDSLNIRFTPTDAGGSYGNQYVQAVWLTTTTGQRICTVGTGAGKVALWANTRYGSVYTWYTNNSTYRTADLADRTGATQTGYREYNITWDWRKYNTADPDGTVVPDGNYRLEFECSNGNGSAALNRLTVNITKGRTSWVLTPANGDFINVRVEYLPGTTAALAVVNSAATGITTTSARLNGEVTNTGGVNPTVYVYWGLTDGGTTPASWQNSVNLGARGLGTFFTDLSGLAAGTTYYYRCRAVNTASDVWATPTGSFTTTAGASLAIANSAPTSITANSARLNGQVTNTGGVNPTVYVYWGLTDGGTTPASWQNSVNLGARGLGTFFTDLSGLAAGTTYYYRCRAVNTTSDVWASPTGSFNTTTVTVPTNDSLNIRFTPTDAGGNYGNQYVQAVWLTTTTGQRVCTVGTGGGKVALWANTRYGSVYTWYTNNSTYRTADLADRTGATQSGYREYNIAWDWRKYNTADPDGTVVPDGTYRLEFECSNDNGSAALNRLTVNITKGRTPWVVTPANGDFINVRVEYLPGATAALAVANTGAADITAVSARLNGEVTATGGVNPSVYVYWGQTDGGTTPANWQQSVALGVLGQGAFSTDISGLTAGTTYYYRCRAVNAAADAWAESTASFVPMVAPSLNTVFAEGDTWKYFKGTSTPANWNGPAFNDSGWLSGPSGIGFGDNDDATVLSDMTNNYTTVYLRRAFYVDLPADVTGLTFTVDYDDGFVAFINGQEVARRGVAAGQTRTTTATSHEASAGSSGNPPETISLSAHISKLVAGGNVFAIEVHNASIGSSDLSMIPTLVMAGGMLPPYSRIQLSETVLDFGQITLGQAANLSFTIENTGTLPLNVNTLVITGLSSDAYSIVSPVGVPFTIAPSGVQAVTVRYNPAAPGEHLYAAIAVGSDDADAPVVSVELTGRCGPGPLLALRQTGSVGGAATSVADYGSHILLGQGATLAVMDVSNAAAPRVSKQVRLANRIEAIAVRGDIAYIAAGASGLLAVDLKTIPSPIEPVQYGTSGHAYDVACQGNYLCVADGFGGMQLYDVSTPASPALRGSYKTPGPAKAVRISGDTAYVLDEKGLTVIALNTLPLAAQHVFHEVEFGQALEVVGNTAYLSDTLGGFFVVDVTGAPVLRGHTRPQAGLVRGIDVVNSYAYLAAAGGLEVMDISNPAAPVSLFAAPTAGSPSDLVTLNNTLYLADGSGGLRVLTLSNPAAPTAAGVYQNQAYPTALAGTTSGGIYAAQGGAGLTGLDLSHSLSPKQLSLLDALSNARDVAVNGNYVYLARGLDGMQIVDISVPSSPVLKGTFATGGFCSSVAASGPIAVLADGNRLYAVNVSQPMAPVLLNQWTGSGWILDAATDGTYVYAAGGMGVEVYRIGSANSVGIYPTGGIAYAVALSGTTAYAACGFEGLLILNIATPSAPSLMGTFDTTGIAMDVAVSGSRVCVAEAGFGVTVLDVSVPSSPVLYARSILPQNAIGILTADSRIFVADERGGLAVLAVTPWPTTPSADIDGNQTVDMGDLLWIAENWLAVETDLNVLPENLYYYDTVVNMIDLSVLAGQWQGSPGAVIPPDDTSTDTDTEDDGSDDEAEEPGMSDDDDDDDDDGDDDDGDDDDGDDDDGDDDDGDDDDGDDNDGDDNDGDDDDGDDNDGDDNDGDDNDGDDDDGDDNDGDDNDGDDNDGDDNDGDDNDGDDNDGDDNDGDDNDGDNDDGDDDDGDDDDGDDDDDDDDEVTWRRR